MKITKHFLLIFIFFYAITTHAQKVSNITFHQEQSNIIISYDLETKTTCKISLFVSKNGGITWQGPLKKVTGDIGAKIVTGNKSITWNVLEEFEELRGENIMFQVQADDDIETVLIGNQEWTLKNLDVSTYRNGDVIPEEEDLLRWMMLKTGAWCYYNNNPEEGKKYGKLYNWYAVNDPRGLAPDGYHIPTPDEWQILVREIIKKMRLAGKTISITSDNSIQLWGFRDPTETKKSVFKGLLGGKRNEYGKFDLIDKLGYWWSSDDITKQENDAWGTLGDQSIYALAKTSGLSVRCIKN
jgi:uncharacterized protein (TIGR02145 family)